MEAAKRRIAKRSKDTHAAHFAAAEKAIGVALAKTNEEFVEEYIQPSAESWPTWTHPRTWDEYRMSLRRPADMSEAELEACFDLVQLTSGDDYRSTSGGWHPEAKQREMRSENLRYILVRQGRRHKKGDGGQDGGQAEVGEEEEDSVERRGSDDTTDNWGHDRGSIRAFASLMPTFEDGQPVIYCYEIHLAPDMERAGLGTLLMSYVTVATDRIPTLRKTMLTCFVRNAHARSFYVRLGFAVDESCSPRKRRLRSGKVVEPEYIIMARAAGSIRLRS